MPTKKTGPRKKESKKATLILRVDKGLKREIRHAIAETDESLQAWVLRAIQMLLAAGRKRKEP